MVSNTTLENVMPAVRFGKKIYALFSLDETANLCVMIDENNQYVQADAADVDIIPIPTII